MNKCTRKGHGGLMILKAKTDQSEVERVTALRGALTCDTGFTKILFSLSHSKRINQQTQAFQLDSTEADLNLLIPSINIYTLLTIFTYFVCYM